MFQCVQFRMFSQNITPIWMMCWANFEFLVADRPKLANFADKLVHFLLSSNQKRNSIPIYYCSINLVKCRNVCDCDSRLNQENMCDLNIIQMKYEMNNWIEEFDFLSEIFSLKVSLQNGFSAHICAGTLIDPLHIVTAAHCRDKRKPVVSIVVGFYSNLIGKYRQ